MVPPGRHATRSRAAIRLALPQTHRNVCRIVRPDRRELSGVRRAFRFGRQDAVRRRDHPAASAAAYLREYACRRLDFDAELCISRSCRPS